MRIGVVAPSSRFSAEAAERVRALAAAEFPDAEIVFHPQCFLTHNHFAGPDAARADALVEFANDPALRRDLVRARRLWLVPDRGRRDRAARGRRRGRRPSSAIATPAICSPASIAPAFPISRTGRCRRT